MNNKINYEQNKLENEKKLKTIINDEKLLKENGLIKLELLNILNNNPALYNLKPESVWSAILQIKSLGLDTRVSEAYIVPYGDKAQFQIGWKGYITLARRTGLYKEINVMDIKEGEIVSFDGKVGRHEFDWIQDPLKRENAKTIGYAAFFKLHSGEERELFMTEAQLDAHFKTYSKTYRNERGELMGAFKIALEAMKKKTVIKLLLGKYGELNADVSSDLLNAKKFDSSVIVDGEPDYIDNPQNDKVNAFNIGYKAAEANKTPQMSIELKKELAKAAKEIKEYKNGFWWEEVTRLVHDYGKQNSRDLDAQEAQEIIDFINEKLGENNG